jgi:hypothetical protein
MNARIANIKQPFLETSSQPSIRDKVDSQKDGKPFWLSAEFWCEVLNKAADPVSKAGLIGVGVALTTLMVSGNPTIRNSQERVKPISGNNSSVFHGSTK